MVDTSDSEIAVEGQENLNVENTGNSGVIPETESGTGISGAQERMGGANTPMEQMQWQLLFQQQQMKILEDQQRAMEFNIKEKPMLATLLPEDVNNFLIEWEVYEDTLRQTIGIREPMMQQCLRITLLAELRALGADIKDKSSILEILTSL